MFLGFSAKHSSTVGPILNIRMGHISLQFHVVHNEKFEMVKKILTAPSIPTPHYEFAKIYAATGNEDSAFYHLTKLLDEPIQSGLSNFMEFDPLFMSIHNRSRFRELVDKAKNKVILKRKEVEELEDSGMIPTHFDHTES